METQLQVKTKCPDTVLQAIYGPKSPTKAKDLEESEKRWWRAYSSRKMQVPEEEFLANSLLYTPDHLPHTPADQTPTATH